MKFYFFLDIDGVLTTQRSFYSQYHEGSKGDYYRLWAKFDQCSIDFLNYLKNNTLSKYECSIVLVSSWKNHLNMENRGVEHWVNSCLINAGCQVNVDINWKTDEHEFNDGDRSKEVISWLNKYSPDKLNSKFLILDDSDYYSDCDNCSSNFVRTDHENGIMYDHMKEITFIVERQLK